MIIEVKRGPGWRRLGTLSHSMAPRAKQKEVEKVVVYPGQTHGYHYDVGIRIQTEDDKNVIITLSSSTLVEVLKGIVGNLADVTIAADEELVNLFQSAVKRADEDSRAVVDAVTRARVTTVQRREPEGGTNAQDG